MPVTEPSPCPDSPAVLLNNPLAHPQPKSCSGKLLRRLKCFKKMLLHLGFDSFACICHCEAHPFNRAMPIPLRMRPYPQPPSATHGIQRIPHQVIDYLTNLPLQHLHRWSRRTLKIDLNVPDQSPSRIESHYRTQQLGHIHLGWLALVPVEP